MSLLQSRFLGLVVTLDSATEFVSQHDRCEFGHTDKEIASRPDEISPLLIRAKNFILTVKLSLKSCYLLVSLNANQNKTKFLGLFNDRPV